MLRQKIFYSPDFIIKFIEAWNFRTRALIDIKQNLIKKVI
jgi:hypothetical protein